MWRWLLTTTIHNDLAQVEGVPVNVANWSFIIVLALVFAVAIKLVGVLLITALLIIPASTARRFSRTPESMILIASIIGCFSVIIGFWSSLRWDWPTGPAVVVAAAMLFAASLGFTKLRS
jgi:zinc transport system permease protein